MDFDEYDYDDVGTELQYLILNRPATGSCITLYSRENALVGAYTNNVHEFIAIFYPEWEYEQHG